MINCTECVEKLYGYLDRQLSAAEIAEVREHLDRCPPCADHFRFEAGILTRIHQVCHQVEVPPALVDRVRQMCSSSQPND